jgi:gamma-glutamyltranspeptidase/glutathione hydrolase
MTTQGEARSRWLIEKSEAVATGGMVTAMQPLAAEAGAEMLRRGGNAIDAAVAIAFAVGVVEPFMSGVGGIAFLVYRDGATGETLCLDGSTALPAAIRPELFELLPGEQRAGMYNWRATRDDANNTGWLAPAVPGTPALLGEAHRRHGRLPWRETLEPAIRLAAEGFLVNQYVSMMFVSSHARLARFPESRRTFIKPNGAPYAVGERLVQPDLARTLTLIADEGAATVYRGTVARLIAADMARQGGLITEAELAAHHTLVRPAHTATYRDVHLLGQLESSGCPTVIEALNILAGFDLAGPGFGSVAATHLVVEALRRAMVDRLRHLGDPDLAPTPLHGIVSPDYAARQRATLDAACATPAIAPGDPWPFEPTAAQGKPARSGDPGESQTTHINVVDRDGAMVSLTSTLGGGFGAGVIPAGTGILLNNAVTWFDPEPGAVTSIGPGKRVMSAAAPMILLRDGRPYAAIGSPGGRRVMSAVAQLVVNLVDFGMGMQAAVSAPRVHSEGPITEISNRYPTATVAGLERLGHQLLRREDSLAEMHFARPSGIAIDQTTGRRQGGVFQFTPATALGVD